jgi:hypothetical protein
LAMPILANDEQFYVSARRAHRQRRLMPAARDPLRAFSEQASEV